jgi:DNA-binding transcriptional LysR family regulator
VQALTGSLIDVGFLRPPVHSDALALETILREPFVVALPESDALASSSTVSLVSLAGAPFILSPRHAGQGFYDHILTFCLKFGFSPRVVQEAAETQTIVSLVAAGIGVALVPASVEKLRLPGVIYRRLREQSPTLEMALASRQEDRSPVLRAFINVVREGRRA